MNGNRSHKKCRGRRRHRYSSRARAAFLHALFTVTLYASVTTAADEKPIDNQRIDASVEKALAFLAAQQQPSGAWTIDAYGESTAATSLAIMSFLSAGHVPDEGPYRENIERGLRFVLDHQQPNGMIVHKKSHGPFYCHGISTLMLAEITGMVDEELAGPTRLALERAVKLILEAQRVAKPDQHGGGWRYQVTSRDSDLSVTGWQLLALRAAKDAGCDVPAESIERAVEYVKRCSSAEDGGFGYQPGSQSTPTRSGTGILALEVCGEHRTPEAVRAADYLLAHPLRDDQLYFYYGAYYCTLGMFKLGDEYWAPTRAQVFGQLLSRQQADGSWVSRHGSENSAGPVYSTCMAVLALTVEYRYLPIYQR